MIQRFFLFLLLGGIISSCSVNKTMRAMECNKQAIDMSTCAIWENAQAIEEANQKIDENSRRLEAINKALKHVTGG